MRFLSLLLSSLVALNPIWAQTASVPTESVTDTPLHIQLIDSPGPAGPQTTAAKGFVLHVTSPAGAPLSGAAVALRLPDEGATGRFPNGLRAWVAYSDTAGIARFPAIQWGETAGQIQLKVTAAKGTSHAALLIPQNVAIDPTAVSVVSVPLQLAVAQPAQLALPQLRSSYPLKPLTVETAAVTKPALALPPTVAVPTPQPGSLFQPLADVPPSPVNLAATGASASQKDKPHALTPTPPPPAKEASSEPTVSITNAPTGAGGGESHKKMWIILGLAGGAGAAAVFAVLGHGGAGGAAGANSNSGVTVGAPTVTIGH